MQESVSQGEIYMIPGTIGKQEINSSRQESSIVVRMETVFPIDRLKITTAERNFQRTVEVQIKGGISKSINPPAECRFRPRCPIARDEICGARDHPPLEEKRPGHLVACYLVDREFAVAEQ